MAARRSRERGLKAWTWQKRRTPRVDREAFLTCWLAPRRRGSARWSAGALAARALFDEFDFVAVRIFDECDDRRAVLHRARLANDVTAGGANCLAGGVDVIHTKGDV